MPLPNPEQRAAFMARPPPAERLLRISRHVGALRDQYRILRVAVAANDAALTEQTVDEMGAILKKLEESV